MGHCTGSEPGAVSGLHRSVLAKQEHVRQLVESTQAGQQLSHSGPGRMASRLTARITTVIHLEAIKYLSNKQERLASN